MRQNRFLFILLLFLYGCAQIVAPTGGPRDVTPPAVVKEQPPQGTTNYTGKSIRITFDEFFTLNNPLENIIFSPPLTTTPNYKIKRKSLVIEWEDTLLPNKTYNIILSNAIKDYTEGNPLSIYQYAFSTGDEIDTASIQGTIINAETREPQKDLFIFLYDQFEDSLPIMAQPQYLTKSKADGSFQFKNITEGEYKIFALQDMNGNLRFDLPGEGIAFLDEPIQTDQEDTIDLAFFTEDHQPFLISPLTVNRNGEYRFKLNKSCVFPQQNNLRLITSHDLQFYEEWSPGGDTLTLFTTPLSEEDTAQIEITISEYQSIDTLILAPYKPISTGLWGRTATPPPAQVSALHAGSLYEPLTLRFDPPISPTPEIPYTLIRKDKEGEDTSYHTLSTDQPITRMLPVEYPFEPGKEYTILFRDSLFQGYHGRLNDSIQIRFKMKTERDYGTLSILYRFKNQDCSYIVELLDSKSKVVYKQILSESQRVNYEHLTPGNYKVRFIFDRNRNGKWDTGNYLKKIQPERILLHDQQFTVRGFWELEEEIEVR